MSRVFELEHGYVIWVTSDENGTSRVDSMSFRDIVARGKAAGESYGSRVEILSLDVVTSSSVRRRGSLPESAVHRFSAE